MKFVTSLLCLATLVWGAALLLDRAALTTGFIRLEWLVVPLAVAGAIAWWRVLARRRARQRLDEMRDSALW